MKKNIVRCGSSTIVNPKMKLFIIGNYLFQLKSSLVISLNEYFEEWPVLRTQAAIDLVRQQGYW